MTVCARLNEDVSDCRRLYRPGFNGESAVVGDELAEQRVLRSAANNMNDCNRLPAEFGRRGYCPSERNGE
jgi:hypothetical protein